MHLLVKSLLRAYSGIAQTETKMCDRLDHNMIFLVDSVLESFHNVQNVKSITSAK